jgi:hypothetical protein
VVSVGPLQAIDSISGAKYRGFGSKTSVITEAVRRSLPLRPKVSWAQINPLLSEP